jgi:hypothetical protein
VSAPVHEVIVGPAGDTRTRIVSDHLAADVAHSTAGTLMIDVRVTHPHWAYFSAKSVDNAKRLLSDALARKANERSRLLVITIESANEILKVASCRALVEQILHTEGLGIKFRLVVPSLDLANFGGSTVIRDAVLAGDVIEAVAR